VLPAADADLTDADLRDVRAIATIFTEATLVRANLDRADLTGALLLHALYDTIADEPIPERLLAVIGKCDKQEDTPLPASVSVSTR